MGLGQKDSVGKSGADSNIWFKQYQNDPNGKNKCPEFIDIIGWFIHEYMPEGQGVHEFDLSLVDQSYFQ